MLINLSGRGDKDMETATDWFDLGRRSDGARGLGRPRSPRRRPRRLVGYLPAGFPTVVGGIAALRVMVGVAT
jgi:hypothetical protein